MAMDTFLVNVSHDQIRECSQYLQLLREQDPEAQQDAAARLKRCVERAVKDLSTEQFESFEATVHRRVFELLDAKVRVLGHIDSLGSHTILAS